LVDLACQRGKSCLKPPTLITVKTFSCQELELLPASALSDLTIDEIKAIPADEFKTCYSALGAAEWEKTKCDELYKKIKSVR
jgi:hypothetical protein